MRKPWIVGVLVGLLLLGACGDPSSGPEAAHPARSDPGTSPSSASEAHGAREASPSSTTQQQRPPASSSPEVPTKRPTVLYLGDSLAMENQKVLGGLLRDELRARYTSAPYSGTTLCDYLEGTGQDSLVPAKDKAAALVRALRPDFVVLQFWGNAWGYTPCMDGITHDKARARYFARYAADAKKLTAQIADASGAHGPKVVWVLQGPDPITPDRIRRVNAIYERQADASGALLADAGKAVSPATARYTWTQYLPCTAYERDHSAYCTRPGSGRTALHRDDDYLHFCLAPTTEKPKPCPVRSPGIMRITRAITEAVASATN
ncbi:SGNH/GDSL hydrolase family protein [Streptomyces sporangiiformans]|uniref:SGNH/GDSL hydrolase family protein n=1 Tax=Streptomyces sporangiiformans TaxID=2315329 RepID=A0A505DGI2_9ACTN|nr:SGNH/GDSL hydrolase family protein [Streptomyces sporangiiformans]TPQ17089.1 SGNH/GDSL hydrolase family protein [Streptomyces sporangiiformans]